MPVPNGVPIPLEEIIATKWRWVDEHWGQRPGWWRPIAWPRWRAEHDQLLQMDLSEVAARMRGA